MSQKNTHYVSCPVPQPQEPSMLCDSQPFISHCSWKQNACDLNTAGKSGNMTDYHLIQDMRHEKVP